jgi:hypothetical protein
MRKGLISAFILFVVVISALHASACTGARPLSMGGAFIAVSDSADATYWNPAALAFVGDSETHTGNSELMRYPKNDAYSVKVSPKKAVGFFQTENQQGDNLSMNYDIDWHYRPTGYFMVSETKSYKTSQIPEIWQGTSFSQRVSKRSAVGVNFKISTPNISPTSSTLIAYKRAADYFSHPDEGGMQLLSPNGQFVGVVRKMYVSLPPTRYDIDFAYKLKINKNLSAGFLLQNTVSWYATSLPTTKSTNPRLGVAYHKGRTTMATDYYGAWHSWLFGVEHRLNNRVTLRGGRYDKTPTSGLSWKVNKSTSVNASQFGNAYSLGVSRDF